MKKDKIVLAALAVLFVALRLFLVSSQRDAIYDANEFFPGTIAMELIQGPSLPFQNLFPDDHNFGSVVNGILMVPFFLLWGPSGASAKIVPILFSLGVLVLWYLLLKRFFNRSVAILASLLFIFSPTVYTKCSVLSIGSHPESSLFTAAILFMAYLIFFDHKKKNIYFILLGLISGFGFFYSYLCGVTLLTLFIFWFAFDRKFIFSLKFYLFLIFAFIGFSPRIYFESAVDLGSGRTRFVTFFYQAVNFQGMSFSHIILKAKNFLTKDLLRLFNFERLPSYPEYLYYAFFSVCFLYLLWMNRYALLKLAIPLKIGKEKPLSRESIILLFPLVFFPCYILSSYTVWPGWQNAGYIVPLYPFIFAIVALGSQRLMQTRQWLIKGLFITVWGAILLAGLYENITSISFGKIGQGFIYKGYSYRMLGEKIGASNFHYAQIVEQIKNIDFSKRKFFLQGFGWGMVHDYNADKTMVARVEEFLKEFSFSREDRFHCFKGLGRGIAHQMALRLYHKAGIDGFDIGMEPYLFALQSIHEKDEEMLRYFWEGFGQGYDFPGADKLIGNYVDERYKGYFYQGMGENIAEENLEGTGLNLIEGLNSKYYKACAYSGYQERLSESLLNSSGYGD
ncbi:MAG: glycosyltransferase family 39 protein [Candidatus Omnitrophota bacterium]